MKKTILWSIVGVLAIVFAVLLYNVLSKEFSPLTPELQETTTAPKTTHQSQNNTATPETTEKTATPDYRDFTVYTYEGDAVTLSEIADEGKPVVINFWTTWCGYCKEEMPDFNEVYKEYADRVNFMMVDVNGNGNDDMDEAFEYVNDQGFEFPVYYDSQLSATNAYGLYSFPTTVIINSRGETIYAYPGMMNKQTLVSYIESALN